MASGCQWFIICSTDVPLKLFRACLRKACCIIFWALKFLGLTFAVGCVVCVNLVHADSQHFEFFEGKVRPVLANHCFECHSGLVREPRSGLRLDSRKAILKGGERGPAIIPGNPDESRLIRFVRHQGKKMPASGKPKLSDPEIAALARWVELGAPWPKATVAPTTDDYDWPKAREHWAWRPVEKVIPPTVSGARVRNPIDQFVAEGLRDADLRQAPEAKASVFVRRVFLGLVGLPPSPDELRDWTQRLGGDSARELNDPVVAALVDSLLNRPQYGERWGRHWLDVARYSDVGGWTQDNRSHPKAWQYRDWVVRTINADLPYDEFVRSQIVGDKMGRSAAAGTGFFALGPTYTSDGGDPESIAQAKSETLDDRVDTFSRAFLGLTVACARCHDHKFDPIPIEDYYSIAGVFNNTREGETPLADPEVINSYHNARKPIDALHDKIRKAKKQPQSDEKKKQIADWQKEVKELEAKAPPKFEFAHTLRDSGSGDMKVALRGNALKPGEVAPRRFLRIVAGKNREHFKRGSGREQLAKAVADPANPLTVRVFVNRVWQHHLGQGLVRSPDNFGTLGQVPTHPELLDWLSATFVESGWSTKALNRLILTSATYRSSSAFDDTSFASDGDNRSLWRVTPRRMDVETWRDSLLAVTGELDLRMGGGAVGDIVASNRRTLYAKVSRNAPLASDKFLRLFDFPIPRASAAKRTANVVPQQFLFMMNSRFMLDRAGALAKRLEREAPGMKTRIARAYWLLYGREPTEREQRLAKRFLEDAQPAGNGLTRWQQYCQALLSANEFMYIR